MAGNIYTWSTTAATNASADPDINWAEGQTPGSVNDSARALMAGDAGFLKDNNATLTTGGSAGAYTVTSNIAIAALATGLKLRLKANFTNTGAATLNLTPAGGAAFGAKSIRVVDANGTDHAIAPGDIQNNGIYDFNYDAAANAAAGAWILLNPTPGEKLITSGTLSAASSLSLDVTVGSFNRYRVVLSHWNPATATQNLLLRVSLDNGSTYKNAATDYAYAFTGWSANNTAATGASNTLASSITCGFAVQGSGSPGNWIFDLEPGDASNIKLIHFKASLLHANGVTTHDGAGAYVALTTAITNLQFFFASGNISSGSYALYGIRYT